MASKLSLARFKGNEVARERAERLVQMMGTGIYIPRVIISGPRIGKTLMFSMIEADTGIESRVRKLWANSGIGVDQIKEFFAEARQVEGGVVCIENAEFINSNELIHTLIVELDEPGNNGIAVFFLTRTPHAELHIALRRRLDNSIELVRE